MNRLEEIEKRLEELDKEYGELEKRVLEVDGISKERLYKMSDEELEEMFQKLPEKLREKAFGLAAEVVLLMYMLWVELERSVTELGVGD